MAADDVLVRADGVSKRFCRDLKRSLWYGVQDALSDYSGAAGRESQLRKDEFWAVDEVSFELRRGECLGLIGRNGAGKTTLLKMLNGLIKPDRGRIEMRGRIGALIALGAGFNPILTGRENVYINGAVLGLSKREIDAKLDEIVDFSGVENFIDAPVRSYSSGMQVRLGFAVATAVEPDVLLLDEVLAVGDAAFRDKCYRRIVSLRKRAAVIFVTHHMEQIARICESTLVMSKGVGTEYADIAEGIRAYETLNENTDRKAGAFLSLGNAILSFSCTMERSEIMSGESLALKVRMTVAELANNYQLRIVLYSSGGFAADGTYSLAENGIKAKQGENTWDIVFGPLHLRNGLYQIAFNVIDPAGDIVVWSYKQHELRVTGAFAGANAAYQVPVARWSEVHA